MTARPLQSLLRAATLTIAAAVLAGCLGGDGASGRAPGDSKLDNGTGDGGAAPPASVAPVIAGFPPLVARVGQRYEFLPSATDKEGDSLTFSIANRPVWLSLDASTGLLSGTPSDADVGTHEDIVLSVTDGTSTTSLPAFSITVTAANTGIAAVSWSPPVSNEDGSPLTDLQGYRIYYGRSPDALTQVITITSPGTTTHVVGGLTLERWYFAVTAVSAAGAESARSTVVSKLVTG